jgi:hypothetical protein
MGNGRDWMICLAGRDADAAAEEKTEVEPTVVLEEGMTGGGAEVETDRRSTRCLSSLTRAACWRLIWVSPDRRYCEG